MGRAIPEGTVQGSPRSPLTVEDTMVSLHLMSVLCTAVATAAALIPEESTISSLPIAPQPAGLRAYGPALLKAERPTLAWNPQRAQEYRALDGYMPGSQGFWDHPGRLSQGLTPKVPCLPRGQSRCPPALASYLGTGSPLVTQYCEKAEPLLCHAIEAHFTITGGTTSGTSF